MSSEDQRHKNNTSDARNKVYNYSEIELNEGKKENDVEGGVENNSIYYENILPKISTNNEQLDKKELKGNPSATNTYLGKKQKKIVKPENIRKSAFYAPMKYLKKFFKESFGLNFKSFNCEKVFGLSIGHMKQILDWQIYQILGYYQNYYIQIEECSGKNMEKSQKLMFHYFMTRTYEEIYEHYISGNIDFPFIPDGTVRICNFITLKKKIEEKKNKFEADKEDKEYIEKYIRILEELSRNMINDLKNEKNMREERKELKLTKIVCLEFDEIRKSFNEVNDS